MKVYIVGTETYYDKGGEVISIHSTRDGAEKVVANLNSVVKKYLNTLNKWKKNGCKGNPPDYVFMKNYIVIEFDVMED